MPLKVEEQLSHGRSMTVFLGANPFLLDAGWPQPSSFRGELAFRVKDAGGDGKNLELTGMGAINPGRMTEKGPTGTLSVQILPGPGKLMPSVQGWSLTADIKALVLYRAIEEQRGFEQVEPGVYRSFPETFSGRLQVELIERSFPEGDSQLVVVSGQLDLTYESGGLGWIKDLIIPIAAAPVFIGLERAAPAICPADRTTIRRRLKLQPVGFMAGPNDPHPSGGSWPAQLAAAQRIWGACCLDLEAAPLRPIDNVSLKTGSDPTLVWGAFSDPNPLVIEVFLVDAALAQDGGGVTFSGGSGLDQVVMTDRNAGNPNLLAHEIGHVLGGLHPGSAKPFGWAGDPGTVLDITHPTPGQNSLNNCMQVSNPVLVSTAAGCCISAT